MLEPFNCAKFAALPQRWGGGLSYHCFSIASGVFHQWCMGKDVYYPLSWTEVYNTTLCGVSEYNPTRCQEQVFGDAKSQRVFLNSHPDFDVRNCFCCCACYAWGTPIATPDGEKAIETFERGDQVSVASIDSSGGTIKLSWGAKPVEFSDGTPPLPRSEQYPYMVFVHYGEDKHMICTLDQLFLLTNGKLKQAANLTINDKLVGADGSEVGINAVQLAEYGGGLHHIATSLEFDGNMDGHLLNSNGVVTGDYTLQVHYGQLGDRAEEGYSIGTPEYHQQHAQLAVAPHAYASAEMRDSVDLPTTLNAITMQSAYIPPGARSYINQDQAIDIISNSKVKKRPFGDTTGRSVLLYVFKIYKTFYPEISFYLDWNDMSPTAYAFEAYGQKQVVVSGGLVRLDGVYFEGMALIVAQCVAAFYQPDEETNNGVKSKGLLPRIEADYYGVAIVMRDPWFLNLTPMLKAGIEQVTKYFSYISSGNAQGDPTDPANDPSIACREQALANGWLGGGLPPCASGQPTVTVLEIEDAERTTDQGVSSVTITFSAALDKTSAEEAGNYTADPAVNLTSAKVDSTDATKVKLAGDFTATDNYKITIANVKGGDGSELDPQGNVAFIQK